MATTNRQQVMTNASIVATADNQTIVYIQEQTGEAVINHDPQTKEKSKHALVLSKENKTVLLNLFEDELQFRVITVYDVMTGCECYIDVVTTAWLKQMQNIKDVENLFFSSMNGTRSDITNYGDAFRKEQEYHNIPGESSDKIETTTFVRFFMDTPAQIIERCFRQMNHLMKCLDLIGDNVVYLIPNKYENCIKAAEELKRDKAVTLNNGYAYVR